MLQPWEQRAACKDTPIEWWFGKDRDQFRLDAGEKIRNYRTREQTAQAKAVCAGCPVRAECLAWALEQRIEFGILGGLTEHERRQLLNGQDLHG